MKTAVKDEKVEGLLANLKTGSSITGACKAVGISTDSYYNWFKKDEEFASKAREALKHTIDTVVDALYNNALHGGRGYGDTTAQIFLLCNRDSRNWKHVQHIQHGVSDEEQLGLRNLAARALERGFGNGKRGDNGNGSDGNGGRSLS